MHSVPIGMPVAVITSNPFDEEVHVITSDGCLCHFLGQGRTTLPNSGRAAPRLTNVLGGLGRGKFKIHLRCSRTTFSLLLAAAGAALEIAENNRFVCPENNVQGPGCVFALPPSQQCEFIINPRRGRRRNLDLIYQSLIHVHTVILTSSYCNEAVICTR